MISIISTSAMRRPRFAPWSRPLALARMHTHRARQQKTVSRAASGEWYRHLHHYVVLCVCDDKVVVAGLREGAATRRPVKQRVCADAGRSARRRKISARSAAAASQKGRDPRHHALRRGQRQQQQQQRRQLRRAHAQGRGHARQERREERGRCRTKKTKRRRCNCPKVHSKHDRGRIGCITPRNYAGRR